MVKVQACLLFHFALAQQHSPSGARFACAFVDVAAADTLLPSRARRARHALRRNLAVAGFARIAQKTRVVLEAAGRDDVRFIVHRRGARARDAARVQRRACAKNVL